MTTPAEPGFGRHDFPYDDLHAELEEHPEGRAALDRLRDALAAESTRRADVEEHARVLQSIPAIRARIANWFDSPTTQGWLDGLSEIGL